MEQNANENGAQSANSAQVADGDISKITNRAGFMGTVCSAPQTLDFGNSQKTSLRLAISERATNKDGSPMLNPETGEQLVLTEFLEIQGWGKTGEKIAELAKSYADYKAARDAGDESVKVPRMWVEGELKEERWEKDGNTASRLVLVADKAGDMSTAKGHWVNRVVLKGNLVRDTETKEFDNGGKVMRNSLGVNKEYKRKNDEQVKEVSFFNLDVHGKPMETFDGTKKGDYMQIDGKLRMDTWQTEEGQNRTALKIVPLSANVISRAKNREAEKAFAPKRSAERAEEYSR